MIAGETFEISSSQIHKNKYENAWIHKLQVQSIVQILKIPFFHLFHDLDKIGKSSLDQ